MTYDVGILVDAGWEPDVIVDALERAATVFRACGVEVAAERLHWVRAPDEFLRLDEPEQERLLSMLPGTRPMVFFVAQTTAGDTSYAYLESAPVASRGTAWITRRSHVSCTGALLAHELGHILFDDARHSKDPGNLMAYTCTHSNVVRSRVDPRLNPRQCRQLRDHR